MKMGDSTGTSKPKIRIGIPMWTEEWISSAMAAALLPMVYADAMSLLLNHFPSNTKITESQTVPFDQEP
jgi:hypothetical protein